MKTKKVISTILISILLSIVLIILISKRVNPTIYRYANIEVKRLTNNIIVKYTRKITTNKNLEDLFKVNKNQNNEIEIIEFDTVKVNELLENVASNITEELLELENGNINNIDLPNSLMGINYKYTKKGIICEIPIGILFNSDILANLGTNIPIKLVYSGKVNTYINSKIKEYGINNAYVSVNLVIEVQGRIVMPTTSKEITIKNSVPLIMRIINGKIPEYYQGINEKSQIYSLPIKE